MAVEPKRVPIPRWLVRTVWTAHRGAYLVTGGHFGLRIPRAGRYGMLRLRTTGRRSGQERVAILGYLEDGPDLILMSMNGWADPAPAWWLNLQAHPDASVDLPDASRTVSAREATPGERPRLWAMWGELDKDLDGYAAALSHETPVVILVPRSAPDA